jgi:hypothetical protein
MKRSILPIPRKIRHLNILCGAGISEKTYPGTNEIIMAITEMMVGTNEARALIEKADAWIRFEYLLQIVKDYCYGNLDFLKAMFPKKTPKTSYHYALAEMTTKPNIAVFTTNFDQGIELAHEELKTLADLKPVYRDEQFRTLINEGNIRGLLKLHGSLPYMDTLGVTFDGIISLNKISPKMEAFKKRLSQGPLLVIGYSASDDIDITPILKKTGAFEQEVYWFIHGPGQPQEYPISKVPPDYKKRNPYMILDYGCKKIYR